MTATHQLQVSLNSGPPQTGGITGAAALDTVDLSMDDAVGVTSQRWEIYDYPVGFTCPVGWSDDGDGIYYSTAATPDQFALGPGLWGKYALRLTVNGGYSEQIIGKSTAWVADPLLIDEATLVSVPSSNGLRGLAQRESAQFSADWSGEYNHDMHLVELLILGAGFTPPTGGEDGYAAIASSGDFVYVGGSAVGDLLVWSGSAWAASKQLSYIGVGTAASSAVAVWAKSADTTSGTFSLYGQGGTYVGFAVDGTNKVSFGGSTGADAAWEAYESSGSAHLDSSGGAFIAATGSGAGVYLDAATSGGTVNFRVGTGYDSALVASETGVDILEELSIEDGTSYTARYQVETTDASADDYLLLTAPSGVVGSYEVTADWQGVDTDTGDLIRIIRTSVLKVASDGTMTLAVDNDVNGTDYDDVGVGTCQVRNDETDTDGLYVTTIGEATTTIEWDIRIDVIARLETYTGA